MKPNFITCAVDSIKYKGSTLVNSPVNLSLCTQLEKGRLAWYPDNEGRPTIEFKGCDARWVYTAEEARDTELERILQGVKDNVFI